MLQAVSGWAYSPLMSFRLDCHWLATPSVSRQALPKHAIGTTDCGSKVLWLVAGFIFLCLTYNIKSYLSDVFFCLSYLNIFWWINT